MQETVWEILGIYPSADPEFIKEAYEVKRQSLAATEDRHGHKRRRLEQAYHEALAKAGQSVQTREDGNATSLSTSAPNRNLTKHKPAVSKRLVIIYGVLLLLAVFGLPAFQNIQTFFNSNDYETFDQAFKPSVKNSTSSTNSKVSKQQIIDQYKNSKNASVTQQFFYYFYLEPSDQDKTAFVNKRLTKSAQAQVKAAIKQPEIVTLKSVYDAGQQTDYIQPNRQLVAAIANQANYWAPPYFIAKLNDKDQITELIGGPWSTINKTKYQHIWDDMNATPANGLHFFVVGFLVSADRLSDINDNTIYYGKHIEKLLKQHVKDAVQHTYSRGTIQYSVVAHHTYIILNDAKDRPGYILRFNIDGQIDKIYAKDGKWDPYPTKLWQQVIEHAEKKIGMY